MSPVRRPHRPPPPTPPPAPLCPPSPAHNVQARSTTHTSSHTRRMSSPVVLLQPRRTLTRPARLGTGARGGSTPSPSAAAAAAASGPMRTPLMRAGRRTETAPSRRKAPDDRAAAVAVEGGGRKAMASGEALVAMWWRHAETWGQGGGAHQQRDLGVERPCEIPESPRREWT